MKNLIRLGIGLFATVAILISLQNCSSSHAKNTKISGENKLAYGGATNPCDNVPSLQEMDMEELNPTLADSLYKQFRDKTSSRMFQSMMSDNVARYMICNGAQSVYTRFSIKNGTASDITVQYVGTGGPNTIIISPKQARPTCPTLCYPPN
jgi:hypothetical protein